MDKNERLVQINGKQEIKAGFYQKDNKLVYVQENGDYFDVDFDKLKEKEGSRLKEILKIAKGKVFDLEAGDNRFYAGVAEMLDGQPKAKFALSMDKLKALADAGQFDDLENYIVGDPYQQTETYNPEKATEMRSKWRGNKNIFDFEDWEKDTEPAFFKTGEKFIPDKNRKDQRDFVLKKSKLVHRDTLEGKISKDFDESEIIGSVDPGYDPTDYFANPASVDFVGNNLAANVLKRAQERFQKKQSERLKEKR